MEIISIQKKGEYFSCDIPLTKDDWIEALKTIAKPNVIRHLLYFYYADNHKGTCKEMALRYNDNANAINATILQFGKTIQKHFNRFEIQSSDQKHSSYWVIPMETGRNTDKDEIGLFEWQLRKELVAALRDYLNYSLISVYKKLRKDIPLEYTNEKGDTITELYKWKLVTKAQGLSPLEFVKMGFENLVDAERVNATFKYLLDKHEEDFTIILRSLCDEESNTLNDRLAQYKASLSALLNNVNSLKRYANDERTASAILTCYNPQKYTFYKYEVYKAFCQYLGIEVEYTGQCFEHYLKLLEPLTNLIQQDEELKEIIQKQTSGYIQSDILIAQDVLWMLMTQRKEYIAEIASIVWYSRSWLCGYTFYSEKEDGESQLDKFISGGYWEGRFDKNKNSDKRQIALVRKIKKDDILILKSTFTNGVGHINPVMRISAIGYVKSIEEVKEDNILRFICRVEYINNTPIDFVGKQFGKYRQTIAECIIPEIKEYINSIQPMTTEIYQPYKELLETNKNLILTGAPGTGKTYMAHRIADLLTDWQPTSEEDKNPYVQMVQFHPSYDYTDFVEGLRPNSNGCFDRVDGVFKEFCKKALENLINSERSQTDLEKEQNSKDRIFAFLDNTDETKILKTKTGATFIISDFNKSKVTCYNEKNNKTSSITINISELETLLNQTDIEIKNVGDVTKLFERKNGQQKDSYLFAIYNEIQGISVKTTSVAKVERKNFIFIIDEINRGEISKIFGELFFSIDPGYRGKKEWKVSTQYQNLLDEDDDFYDGFFIPENVYIIGTMNDIDRSVESMDFAMRRRFAWKEVTAEESFENIIQTSKDYSDTEKADIKARMERLNNVICENKYNLGEAYQIGAAYFNKYKDYRNWDKLWENHLKGLIYEYVRGEHTADDFIEQCKKAYYGTNESADNTNDGQ